MHPATAQLVLTGLLQQQSIVSLSYKTLTAPPPQHQSNNQETHLSYSLITVWPHEFVGSLSNHYTCFWSGFSTSNGGVGMMSRSAPECEIWPLKRLLSIPKRPRCLFTPFTQTYFTLFHVTTLVGRLVGS